ncbi:MAG TPA: response regulator [Thermoanaerobaculia bacterium]|nr:response regulator [Thermoanaerobaculia bacterium]
MLRRNVLVVEDDDIVRGLVIQILRERALAVDGARDGADALHRIATRQYSLVILDLMMPHMSGVDFLDSLNVLTFDPTLKSIQQPPAVLVITSAPEELVPSGELQRRFPMVRGVLRKPLDPADLSRHVDALLR